MFAYSVASDSEPHGFGIVTDRFLCLLGSEATLAVARDTYRLLDAETADVGEVLQFLTATHGLVRFAVIELLDSRSRNFAIAVRGKVALELEQASATRLSGASDSAWISTEARGVNTLRLMLDAEVPPGDQQLPIRRGVVATSFVSLETAAAAADPVVESKTGQRPRATKMSLPEPQPVDPMPFDEDTIIGPVSAGSDAWVLTLPDGSEVSVGLPVIVGRRPWSVEQKDREVVHIVAPSSKREISGTHLELFLDDQGVQARDLNSTNGTVVRSPSLPPRLLHAGGTTTLAAGDTLDIGEDFSIALRVRD